METCIVPKEVMLFFMKMQPNEWLHFYSLFNIKQLLVIYEKRMIRIVRVMILMIMLKELTAAGTGVFESIM